VTQTLRNSLSSRRIHHAFVFAGPRGVGKTTTARLLARALNCVAGPTASPCGECDACIEIAQGRDMDVLEIDAATHTGIDNVREVIITGLAISPVRDRYKVFIIDEVHQLSVQSFNALLKSVEEPPPHVVFIMATTSGDRIPDTILSRAQVFEFRPIGLAAIAAQLRMIADAEGLTVPDDALALVARAADGSMRDAESALDQVIAFAGTTITADDVSAVLGIVGRDLLFDMTTAVADEDPAAAFTLAGRAVDLGYELRLVCRQLAGLSRDLLLVSVDPSCAADPDIAAESERDLAELAAGLGLEAAPATEPLPDEERDALAVRVERLNRRREQLGPVNPLAKQEYDEAVAHVEELEEQRRDLESALAELEGLITETDKRIRESFEQTFEAAAKNFEEVVEHLFPGGRGRLRLVQSEGPRAVIAGEDAPDGAEPPVEEDEQPEAGVEIEVTPPGKSTKRLSLLSGGEKSLVALAFMFAVFLARPCPFYILDEVEAALDDANIDRFLSLVGAYADRSQFIVITHQRRTMASADVLYGVSMGNDGVSKVVSRKLDSEQPRQDEARAA